MDQTTDNLRAGPARPRISPHDEQLVAAMGDDYCLLPAGARKFEYLGKGGHGCVVKGTYKGRPAAVKFLYPGEGHEDIHLREALAAGRLMNFEARYHNVLPGVVQYLDVGVAPTFDYDVAYITMGLVQGTDLTARLGTLTLREKDELEALWVSGSPPWKVW